MKQVKITLLPAITLLMIAIWNSSCQKEKTQEITEPTSSMNQKKGSPGFVENDMVLYWNAKAAIVLSGAFNPPSQSRYFAMIQIAVHDALNSIKPKYQRYALLNKREKIASPDAAVASAAYHTITKLNVQASHPVLDWYNECLNNIPDGESEDLGIALGEAAADAIISMRSTDNFAIANQQLPVPDGINPGEYKSTLPFSNPGMPKIKALHQWGTLMAPFVVQNNSQFRPKAPFPVNSSQYKTDYEEVKAKGARAEHTRTPDETEIGVFWVEQASSGWNRFARNMISSKKMDAWRTARLFALMHTAMTDGISGCFEAKYHYFYWRPETAIRLGDNDGNNNTTGDANWLPSYTEIPNPNPSMNVYTPPIPDYPSAHAAFGGVAAEVLRLFFGSDKIAVDQTSPTLPNVTRHYSSISQAAWDNSTSRVYVGYHFRNACLEGEKQGRQIGNYVFNHSFQETDD